MKTLEKTVKKIYIHVVFSIFVFIFSSNLFAQETAEPVSNGVTAETVQNETKPEVADTGGVGVQNDEETAEPTDEAVQEENTEAPDADEQETETSKPVKPKWRGPPEQFQWTPEDPSFLYENRYIPGRQIEEEFLTIEQEMEVAEERIEEEKNFRDSLEKIQFNLPEPGKIAIVVAIIVLFIIYRMRVNKVKRKSRY